jgi:hypothetical protein
MTDLSPEARAIVEASRSGGKLSSTDRDRIKRGVLMRVATVGAAATTAGTAAAMSLASKVTLIAVATAALGGGAVSLWAWHARTAAPARAVAKPSATNGAEANVPMPVVPEAPRHAVEPSPNLGSSDSTKKPGRRAPAAGVSSGASASAIAVGGVDSELEVLRLARDELRRGQPEEAYQRLVDYDHRRGKGMLAQERRALSVIALCQWRPGRDAQARAAEFLRDAPESPLADRVHLACDGAGASNR